MDSIIITNVSLYKAVADEAYEKMKELIESGRRPKADGSDRWTITLDPEQKSFKRAMITIVFTGIWLEAFLHLAIVKKHG